MRSPLEEPHWASRLVTFPFFLVTSYISPEVMKPDAAPRGGLLIWSVHLKLGHMFTKIDG